MRPARNSGRGWRVLAAVLLLLVATPWAQAGRAQETPPAGPVYVVQEGDSVWAIALRFGLTPQTLLAANPTVNPDTLAAGARLTLPGLEGLSGELQTQEIGYGESLRSLSRRYGAAEDVLRRLNRLASPAELFAGKDLIILQGASAQETADRLSLQPGETWLELAARHNLNPWALAAANGLTQTWLAQPNETYITGQAAAAAESAPTTLPAALPAAVQAVTIAPQPIVQGEAARITLTAAPGLVISGTLAGYPVHFFPQAEGYAGYQGIHALAEPGLYTLALTLTQASDPTAVFSFAQGVYIRDGDYVYDPVLTVAPETVDPENTGPEDRAWAAQAQTYTPQAAWSGAFLPPVAAEFVDCFPSRFGNRRSFNGSAYTYFHSGLDFCGEIGDPIYAPAAGTVIFAGPLTVRGNATMIDHGWGIFTGYMHQTEILVQVGDVVTAGQQIGAVGETGRVTGPHLHWEVWVGGVQVNPLNWLEGTFP